MTVPFVTAAARQEITKLLDDAAEVLGGHAVLDERRVTRTRQGFAAAAKKISEMSKRYGEPFRLAVVGEFKVGKSSVINALLGIDGLLAEGVTPTTGAVTELAWGDEPRGRVLGPDETVIFEGSREEAAKYADQRTPQGQRISRLGARVVLEGPYPLLRHVVVIDTPGLGASEADDRATLESLHMADAAILVVSAKRPGGEMALTLAEHLRATGKRLITVVTRADLVDEAQLDAALEEVREIFGEITDGDPLPFSSLRVRAAHAQSAEATASGDRDRIRAAAEALRAAGHTPLREKLESYFSGDGRASVQQFDVTLAELQHALQRLQVGATEELSRAHDAAEKLVAELSEADRIVNEVLRPKVPFLDAKVEDIIDTHVGELVSDLSEALEIFVDRIADGGLALGLATIFAKVSNSYDAELRRRLQREFEDLFPHEQLEITIDDIDRGVRRLLEMEWRHVVSEVGNRVAIEDLDPDAITAGIRDHLAQVTMATAVELTALYALLFIGGGVLADVALLALGVLSSSSLDEKEDPRIRRAKREARHRVRGQRRHIVHQLGRHFRAVNQQTAEAVIEKARAGVSQKARDKAAMTDLAEMWRQASEDIQMLLDASDDLWKGGAR